ncbi:MAG: M16 family metallopeptidase, partial [Acidimicrobiales bacterium]
MIRTERLPSGLALVTEAMTDARSVCIGFWVGTGSRDESPDRAGASHFLEHLLFKGTADRSASAIAEAVDEVGGDFNAFTTKEYTSFYIRLLAEHLPLGLDILSDIMWQPALRESDLDAERLVILDEILMHADEPSDLAAEQSAAALFPGHPLGREVLGTQQSIEATTAEQIRDFFTLHYRPGNMVAAVAGDLDHNEVVSGIEARYNGSSGGSSPERSAPCDSVVPLQVTRRGTEQAHLVMGMRSVGRFDPRRYPLAILNHVLGGGLSSRLFQEIRERRGLAYSVWSERTAYQDTGAVSVGVSTSP